MKEIQELEKMITILAARNEAAYLPVIQMLEERITELLTTKDNE